jgi:hypothetical protein
MRVPTSETARGRSAWGCAVVVAMAGCGSSGQAGHGDPPHTPFPQVIYQGGPLIAAPSVVTVTFPGDAMAPDLQTFGQSVTSSAWWDTVRAGYCEPGRGVCVGDGAAGSSVVLPAPPASSYTDSVQGGPSTLQDWLSGAIAGGTLPAPVPGTSGMSDTLYVAYFPATTTIQLDGITSCTDGGFDGYHGSLRVGAQSVAYAVVVECAPPPKEPAGVRPLTTLQQTTLAASHEIAEAATDPASESTGYDLNLNDTSTWGWIDVEGGEVADLCVDPFGLGQDVTSEGAFTVQRIWSNTQAAAGQDPCNPRPAGGVYFNAAPRQAFFVLDVGNSVTFDVDAFADGDVGDFSLLAQDWSDSAAATYLEFSIAGGTETEAGPEVTVGAGSTVQVTMKLLADPGALPTGEADGAVVSVYGGGPGALAAHYWPFAVLTPADALEAGAGGQARRALELQRRRGIHRASWQRPGRFRLTGASL